MDVLHIACCCRGCITYSLYIIVHIACCCRGCSSTLVPRICFGLWRYYTFLCISFWFIARTDFVCILVCHNCHNRCVARSWGIFPIKPYVISQGFSTCFNSSLVHIICLFGLIVAYPRFLSRRVAFLEEPPILEHALLMWQDEVHDFIGTDPRM